MKLIPIAVLLLDRVIADLMGILAMTGLRRGDIDSEKLSIRVFLNAWRNSMIIT